MVEAEKELVYAHDGRRVHVLSGARPRALAVGAEGVLVTDGDKLFWFEPVPGGVTESIGPPVVYSVAVHGDTYLMAGANKAVEKKVFRW